jgi:Holliday junction resolvase RusA-like endonuclease
MEEPVIRVRKPKYPSFIEFTVWGEAIPKARARVVHNKKGDKDAGTHAFTPKTTVEWEASIFGQALAHKPPYPWQDGIALGVLFFKRIPKSFNKYKTALAEEGKIRPKGARDDLDNLVKALKDAFKGITWLDDGQVIEYCEVNGKRFGKYYSNTPRVEVRVEFLKDED